MSDTQSYHVEWFVTQTAQFDVTVRFSDDRLVDVERGKAADAIELGSVALIDGLVNAHTHLEFSSFAQPIATTGRFTDWIRAVVQHRRSHPADTGDAIRLGVRESLESGTTLLGEIATSGWSWSDYAEGEIGCVVFQEILGLLPERMAQQKDLVRSLLRERVRSHSIGISPHAPYSTHLDLVHGAVTLANQRHCPLAMHLAETPAELELLADGTGEFRELLTDFGIWRDDRSQFGQRPMDYLEILSQAPLSLIVHGNYLVEDELEFLASQPQMVLVYCPRTHAAFGHREHPWRRLRELGGKVALGTDSRASNSDLSLFAELQLLAANHLDLSHVELLQLGSNAGRQALGFENSNIANFTLIQLEGNSTNEPELFSPTNRVCGTMINGRWAWMEPSLQQLCR